MKIWAHRGCSLRYPENSITAFSNAAVIKGLTGIELDIQQTRDGQLVVIHDERVDRTTDGIGYVKDYTYKDIRSLKIQSDGGKTERIPSINEVLDLLKPKLKQGLLLNIELKNSVFRYPGMEESIVELIEKLGLQNCVVYSSFYAKSLSYIRQLVPVASIGILDINVSDCMFKMQGGCGADALHPSYKGMDMTSQQLKGQTVRAWLPGHLYPDKPTGNRLDIHGLEEKGITDVFLNDPKPYLEEI